MSTVEKMIKDSLQELQKIGMEEIISCEGQESKLIFPKYRSGNQRISEQESRLLFIRELEKQNEFYYSIETPTKEQYNKFSSETPEIGAGRSGCIDMSLYTKDEEGKCCRRHMIEFKFNNVKTCKKDFLKLLCDNDECVINYYINILENCKKNTIPNLEKKFCESIKYIFKNYSKEIKSKLMIFVCILGNNKIGNSIIEYEIIGKNHELIKQKK